jgi:hypothetical protein
MIQVVNYQFKLPECCTAINTTSRSTDFGKGLSPFFLGPVDLYDGYVSQNMENGWQFSKVYGHLDHLDENDNPTPAYFEWAKKGWADTYAHRYPMGKGVKPLYSYWAGEKLDYVAARKKIYIPLYTNAVKKTKAFEQLWELYRDCVFNSIETLYLVDFDAHNLDPSSVHNRIPGGGFDYWKLWNNPHIKVGHAYVLAMLLDEMIGGNDDLAVDEH